ncbi:aspartate ammonia-lyase [Rufibacter quisquiliarum]|uniref:Aspartate ammonia-lyase n=1 Tax=Rufibacter quisquiliarum TaxID=1549639 RepID=A0A839GQS3_9BACT|nr:aspartate ammonia-lyase [Rufibacter quisquiliarum]MBA9077226.1 aspartate ammonia-lyase [Rufibacter quisquiliarum]
MNQSFRIEHDFLGEKQIPNNVYYGVQTLRAKENFNITGITNASEPLFIEAFAYVKKAAAMANRDCGVLEPKIAEAIIYACDRIIAGEFHDQFVTDLIQGGAGTSVNMNANEVIANIGLEYLGHEKGQYEFLHPNNHVNCSQSTNDTYPTAIMMAVHFKVKVYLQALAELRDSFRRKAEEFKNVLKMGRTQLQDAVPMTLGQEFHGWSTTLNDDIVHLTEAQEKLTEINMGATAIGTSINAPEGYPQLCVKYLAQLTKLPMTLAPDLIEATSDMGSYVLVSAMLKRSAIKISKICNDLRLLSSGPRAGLNEIKLPPMQPGSSIMPGKVNPVIPEVVNQTAFYVMGADLTICMAAEAGQLQLNVMEPVIAFSLFTSMNYMINAIHTLRTKCIEGITANVEVCREEVMRSIGIVTALNPLLGYETAASIAKEALATGKAIHDIVVLERKLVTQEMWDEIYTFENMVRPVYRKG